MRAYLLLGACLAAMTTTSSSAHTADASAPAASAPPSAPARSAAETWSPPSGLSPDAAVLLAPWRGPYGGLPPFAQVKVSAFQPAMEEGMREQLAEVSAIANNPAPASFDNTIVALERAGKPLARAMSLYGVWASTENTDEMQAVQKVMEPKLAAFGDQIDQDPKLFARIAAVYESRDRLGLTPEQKQLVWLHWVGGVKAGARLSPSAKARVTAINQELAGLYARFSQNLLADEAG